MARGAARPQKLQRVAASGRAGERSEQDSHRPGWRRLAHSYGVQIPCLPTNSRAPTRNNKPWPHALAGISPWRPTPPPAEGRCRSAHEDWVLLGEDRWRQPRNYSTKLQALSARLGDSFYFARCEIVESLLRRGARDFSAFYHGDPAKAPVRSPALVGISVCFCSRKTTEIPTKAGGRPKHRLRLASGRPGPACSR